jgi:uncharacterized protein YciI
MKHFLLFYDVGPNFVAQRAAYRDAHLQQAWNSHERGELILGGALVDPADEAVLLFAANSPEVVKKFAETDPYVANGLVKKWWVREWNTVVGDNAAFPQRADSSNRKSK